MRQRINVPENIDMRQQGGSRLATLTRPSWRSMIASAMVMSAEVGHIAEN